MPPRPTSQAKRRRLKPRRGAPRPSSEHVYGVPVPDRLHEAIENERDNLSKAASLLACLAISLENDVDPVDEPYFPDIARLARQLVNRSINGLDSLTLQELLLRDQVKEEPWFHLPGAVYH